MMYLIVQRRRLGVALDKRALHRADPVRGDIQIAENHSAQLGRVTVEAWIFTSAPGAIDVLPRLHDVRVTNMGSIGMNLTGIERIGDAFYSQSWWCRLE
ncbi:hypothetical protein [Pseudomonas sp. NA-150]|uniref:hypothetical protein n=1 Tax=Pseudomonas sp. NA-150 TaxID=3367525 RepID=UPI0037CBA15D